MAGSVRASFYGATSASSIMGVAFMWAWWDLAVYSDVFRNWMDQPRGFSDALFIVTMLSAGLALYLFARLAPRAATWLYDKPRILTCIGIASVFASALSMAGAYAGWGLLEAAADVANGAVLGVLLALWGSVMAERGSRSAIVHASLGISLGAVIDAGVIYAVKPLQAAGIVALFPLVSILVYAYAVRPLVDGEVFARRRSTRAGARRSVGVARREFYGLSFLFVLGLSVAEIAFNFMNHQVTYVAGGPVEGIGFNYACHVARAAGAFVCFVFVGALGVSYKRFFWVGGGLMAVAFATMPFWGLLGIPAFVSNYINMACFAMVVIFVFGVLAEISYERKVTPLEPMCFGAIFITGIDSLGVALGMLVNGWLGDDPALVASVSSALGYVLVLALFAIFSEGQRYLDVSTGVAAGRRLQTEEEILAGQAHREMCQRRVEEAGLTGRERDILDDLLREKSLYSIASALGISENTVKTHVQNIYRKFEVHGRQELAAIFAPPEGTGVVRAECGYLGDSPETFAVHALADEPVPPKKAALAGAVDRLAREYGLTRRETEVFALLARGYRHSEIQERLLVSPSTVHTHVTNIYAKMDLHSHADLSRLVRDTRDSLSVDA